MKGTAWRVAGIAGAAGIPLSGRNLPWEAMIGGLRTMGPRAYFGGRAVVSLPLAWSTVPAGEAFAAPLTLGGAIAAAPGAVAVQPGLSHAFARSALRPAIERLVRRRGILSGDAKVAAVGTGGLGAAIFATRWLRRRPKLP